MRRVLVVVVMAFGLSSTSLPAQETTRYAGEFVFRRQPNGSIEIIREEDYWLPRIPSFGVTWEIGG